MPNVRTIAVLALIIAVAALAGLVWHSRTPTPPAHTELP